MTSKEKSPQLIDVRTPEEYSKGHLDGAVNIDFFSPTFMKDVEAELDKEHAIYIYCKSGGRSGKASAQLQEAGFTEIYDLSEGYSGWKH
jgi:rhodanese-related sulfurtransferase